MAAAVALYRSSIGKKAVMAITGFIGYGYVILHMIGNLKVFEGPEGFNHYAEFLRTVGEPAVPERTLLWVVRIVLLVAVSAHVISAIQLTRQGIESRPQGYKVKRRLRANFASMTLRWGGVALFLFLIYHLMHFTFGNAHPTFIQGDAYHNVVSAFTNPLTVGIYLLAVAALGVHLYHGVWSIFQTIGLNDERTDALWRGLSVVSAIGLFVGFSIVPVAVLTGLVR
ncbi:MAG TPA: succinate dehydrogenase cytochrome b subunit [Roseiflexaceae bacterium]|nr:succinate dehydrogenase cytochrome b subunit [Roseiflexaceae bacterium]HMP41396.1 succinate dehydrogenase cytochrome b subunit [Roseiflexaceae bacterium]